MTDEEREAERKRLTAIAMANDVFNALTQIDLLRSRLVHQMVNHDPTVGDNGKRRDCEAFHARLKELNLGDWLASERRRLVKAA